MRSNQPDTPLEKIAGSIERVTFHSEETGFCVLRVKVKNKRELVTVIGNAASITSGEYIECSGLWANDKEHGLQFKASQLKALTPTTLEGIEKYLASGLIKGVGPHFAKILIKAFGIEIFETIENNPSALTKIAGIGQKRQTMILEAWQEQKAIREIMLFLQANGVGTARAVKIYKTYGDNSISIVSENPYRLSTDIYGIGFKTADAIAMRLGIDPCSLQRAQAGINHALQELSNDGHCAIEKTNLIEKAKALLEIPEDILQTAIAAEIQADKLVADLIDDKECIFLKALHQAESLSAKHLYRLKSAPPPWRNIDATNAISWAEQKTGILLSASQKEAVTLALKEKVLIITGGPGVGKTTIVNSIIKIIGAKGVSIALCAPTGRAAKRLSETTNLLAKTIHRLLAFDPTTRAFKHNQHNPLPADFVVVDEASMLDIVLFYNLIKSLADNTVLLLVGDIDQLPSVGPGNVLADIIKSQVIPVVKLTEIFRQAKSSQIIVNAHRVNQGLFPSGNPDRDELSDFYTVLADSPEEIHAKLIHVVTKRIPERFGLHPNDIQVLTPMNRGGLGARSLNIALQAVLNPQIKAGITKFGTTFACGDKVIQNINNYDKEVFNGDIGKITNINTEDHLVKINFYGRAVEYDFNELDEISLAYAISIHKSQGSEYPAIVIPIATQHYMLLARNLLYTGITRGKQLVVIIHQPKALAIAIKNVATNHRITKLATRLAELQ